MSACTVPGTPTPPASDNTSDSSMTDAPQIAAATRGALVGVASLLTQSVKKQPRSPRDKQASPKRARVGAGIDADEQDDTSSTEQKLDDVAALKDDGAQQQAGDESAGTSGTTVFSPVFHCMRTLRTSLDAAHAQDVCDPQEDLDQHPHQLAIRHPAWVHDGQQGLEEQACQELHHNQQQAAAEESHHPPEHAVHHIIPEAVEHELPPDASAEVEEELDYMDFDPLLFIKLLPPLDQVVPKHRPPLLPRKTRLCKHKTLVLDLDETLVHSCLEAQAVSDFTFPVHFNSQEHIIHVRQRPHLHTFMQRAAELFEVVVFTASQKIYAEKLLNIIDPDRKLIKHRIFRESCVVVDGNYLKDLTALGRDLKQTLIIDNSPQAFGFQVDNGVPIESWYDDMADTELLKLLPFLEGLVAVDDVRPAIRNKFRMRELIDRVVC